MPLYVLTTDLATAATHFSGYALPHFEFTAFHFHDMPCFSAYCLVTSPMPKHGPAVGDFSAQLKCGEITSGIMLNQSGMGANG